MNHQIHWHVTCACCSSQFFCYLTHSFWKRTFNIEFSTCDDDQHMNHEAICTSYHQTKTILIIDTTSDLSYPPKRNNVPYLHLLLPPKLPHEPLPRSPPISVVTLRLKLYLPPKPVSPPLPQPSHPALPTTEFLPLEITRPELESKSQPKSYERTR
jgi:hypothetical protein